MKHQIAIGLLLFVAELITNGFVLAADVPEAGAGAADIIEGSGHSFKGVQPKTLRGRVWSQWADNLDNELLFGIQYWNTGEASSGTPSGRSSTQLEVNPPDPLFTCCAWGFAGGPDKSNPYSGWYTAATTVRLAVKDKALMDQIIKASQELIAIEVQLDGRTITGFQKLSFESSPTAPRPPFPEIGGPPVFGTPPQIPPSAQAPKALPIPKLAIPPVFGIAPSAPASPPIVAAPPPISAPRFPSIDLPSSPPSAPVGPSSSPIQPSNPKANGGGGQAKDSKLTPPQLHWNIWTENSTSIRRLYKPVENIGPNQTYLLAIDLSGIQYQLVGVAHKPTSKEFSKASLEWLTTDYQPEDLQILLLLDSKYFKISNTHAIEQAGDIFTTSDKKITKMEIRADKIRRLVKDGWVKPKQIPKNPLDQIKQTLKTKKGTPDWVFGQASFQIETTNFSTGNKPEGTTIGLSIWYRGRPVDEVTFSACLTPRQDHPCKTQVNSTSLAGIDSLRTLSKDATRPDAAIHFVELGSKTIGVFHNNGEPNAPYSVWSIGQSPQEFRKALIDRHLAGLGTSSTESELKRQGMKFFEFLFPKEVEGELNQARISFLLFAKEHLKSKKFFIYAPSVFIRLIRQGDEAPFVIPLGLLVAPLDETEQNTDFIGYYFRLESPLEIQVYNQASTCISRWITVLPSLDKIDNDDASLTAARKHAGEMFMTWSRAEAFDSMSGFAKWAQGKESTEERTRGAAVVVLSHHANDQLSFFNDPQKRTEPPFEPEHIMRKLSQPSIIILNGCGTAGPNGSQLVRRFNQHGFSTVIAAPTEVDGSMAGKFLNILAAKINAHRTDPEFNISRAFLATLEDLSKESDEDVNEQYGPRVLQFSLLGNGALRLCPN
jgi:hypothetical protein